MNKYREERDKLKAYNAELREALAEARKQRDLVAEIASEAQAEAEKQNDIARRYYNLLAKEQKKAIDYEALFKQEVAWGEEKLREVERLRLELDETAALADRLAKGYNEKHDEVERLQAWKDAAESGGGAGVRAARAEAEVERLTAHAENLGTALLESRAEVGRLREQNAGLYKDRAALGLEVERLRLLLKETSDDSARHYTEAERLRTELEDTYTQLAGETTKLTNALAQSEAEVERLRERERGDIYKAWFEEKTAEVERLQGIIEQYEETSPI